MILIVLGGRCSRTIYLCDDGKDPKKRLAPALDAR